MTMPMPAALDPTDELPEDPRIMMMATDGLDDTTGTAVTWRIGGAHPFADGMNVVAIYLDGPVVEVYSAANNLKRGMRDLVPLHRVRLINETMSFDVFNEELRLSELGPPPENNDDDDDPEDDEDPEPEPAPDPTAPSPPVS